MVKQIPLTWKVACGFFCVCIIAFIVSLVFALNDSGSGRRFEQTNVEAALLPPSWWALSDSQKIQMDSLQQDEHWYSFFGTDQLGRDLFSRCIVGGAISIGIGLFAAFIAVFVGTMWGAIAGLKGGLVDASMMRFVDVLYGLPTIMLVVLISVAANSLTMQSQSASEGFKEFINIIALFTAIGAVSWLTVSRVIRGQVKSIIGRPSIEACKTIGATQTRTFIFHILPALVGPIVVYATLTIPTAILSEAFLSFLGIGVKEPMPSWGNLAADGLSQLNPVHSRWWLLFWPCVCIAMTLVSMNWIGQSVRKFVDPTLRETA